MIQSMETHLQHSDKVPSEMCQYKRLWRGLRPTGCKAGDCTCELMDWQCPADCCSQHRGHCHGSQVSPCGAGACLHEHQCWNWLHASLCHTSTSPQCEGNWCGADVLEQQGDDCLHCKRHCHGMFIPEHQSDACLHCKHHQHEIHTLECRSDACLHYRGNKHVLCTTQSQTDACLHHTEKWQKPLAAGNQTDTCPQRTKLTDYRAEACPHCKPLRRGTPAAECQINFCPHNNNHWHGAGPRNHVHHLATVCFHRARLCCLSLSTGCVRLLCRLQKGLLLLLLFLLKMLVLCVVWVAGGCGAVVRCFTSRVCVIRRAASMDSDKSGHSGDYSHIEGRPLQCVCV